MKVPANSIEELLNYQSKYQEIFHEIYSILNKGLEEEPKFFSTNSINMIGYRFVEYKNTNYNGMWPLVSLTYQSDGVRLYVFKYVDNQNISVKYKEVFGKSNMGQSCITIKKLTASRRQAIVDICEQIKK